MTYSGIYFLDRAQRPASVTFDDIAAQMTAVLEPFGFRREQMPQGMNDMILFSHERTNEKDNAQSGEGARISVAVLLRGPSITIRDYDNDKETSFTRAIKIAIEKRLQERYQLKGLKFERQVDILV
ncbi:MAG TPA: hypothetical protein ENJ84_00145 [Gammaproteobacteria bacterium]|nr:hypothetical protein [Gammaproteobacteria bacterium]